MTISFIPLAKWPYRDCPERRGYAYKADYDTVLTDLRAEIDALDARDATVSLCLTRKDVRRDGWPLASARPPHPGVVLVVYTPSGELEFACDENQRWQHNLRAVSLTLTALRAVERHGATKRRQQYAGYLAAPPAETSAEGALTEQDAYDLISTLSGLPAGEMRADRDVLGTGVRVAKKRAHPDTGGSPAAFLRLREALTVLGVA